MNRIAQQFWGSRYFDDSVARRVDHNADGDFTNAGDTLFYYLTDRQFSVSAIIRADGDVAERIEYSPYGLARRIENPSTGVFGDELPDHVKQQMARVNANIGWKLPAPYTRVDRTESQWVALRDALAAERIADKRGEELGSEFETLLLQVRAETATAEAMTWADTRDTAIQTAFAGALE